MPDDINSILGVSSDSPSPNTDTRSLRVRYYLWIDSKQDGPYEPAKIRALIDSSKITDSMLAHPEDGTGDWLPISSYPQIFEIPKPAPATPAATPKFTLPPIEDSVVASALTIIAVLEFIGSPIAGLGVGSDNAELGWVVFVSGVISGLILLGFARVIQNTFESSQRLRRLEMLIERVYSDKNAAN